MGRHEFSAELALTRDSVTEMSGILRVCSWREHRNRGRTLDGIHRLLADGAIAATLVGIGWSLVLVVTGRPGSQRFEQAQAAIVSLFVIAAASGGLLLLSGAQPGEGLHFLYAVIALTAIPLARSFLGRARPRFAAALLLVAFVVLGAVTYRLFTTG